MAVGVTGIQGGGTIPHANVGGGIQHAVGVAGNPTSAHLQGVLTSEDERKVCAAHWYFIILFLQ